MNNKRFLNEKFMMAELPQICAPRRGLLNRFQREAGKRVIFVSAPAGYGKTVSTLLWLSSAERKTIWLTLDGYDNAPEIFFRLFCAGIVSVQPNNKAMMDILKSPSFAASPVEHTIRLLSEFFPEDEQYALVLDDVHLITNREILKSGLLIQKRLPLSFTTLILTRNEIAEEYTSAIGEGRYAVITAKDLAFSTGEIQEYFIKYGRNITPREAAEVHTLTDGWVIGVNALAKSKQLTLAENSGQILGNYIKEQIWDKWDGQLRDFLLKTSIVDEMTTELCIRLTGREDSREILDNLCRSNAFAIKLSGDTYRYHHLFLDFLRGIQGQDDEMLNETLYRIAADYYLERQEYFLARRYSIKSGDSEAIIKSNYALMNTKKSVSVDEYIYFYKNLVNDMIPESVCNQHPYMYSTFVWYYFLMGDARKMEYYMDLLYRYLPMIVQTYPQFIENAILIFVLDHRTSFSGKIDQFGSLPTITDFNHQTQAVSISMQLPYAHRTLRDYYELADESLMGKLANSFGILLKTQYDVVVLELYSGFLYERNLLTEALKMALQTRNAISDKTSDEVIFCSFIHLASIYLAMGRGTLFSDVLNQLEQYIEKNDSAYFRPNLMALKTKVLLMDSNKAEARAWLDHYFVVETEQLELYKIFQHFTTARAYMVLSQTDKAMSYILKLKKLGTDFHRPMDTAEATALQAVLEWALGKKKEAQETLETALADMQQYGFVRVFADEGASILPILKKIAAKIGRKDYEGPLQSHYLHEVILAAYVHAKRHCGLVANWSVKPIKLSKQQKLILSLLAKGYKYNEVVDATGLSIHTVKSHASAAYHKLNVGNSIDAAIKARELGLIE